MATKQISWNTGSGNITLTYQGQGDGTIIVESDQNDLATVRSQTITIETTKGGLKTKNLTITQGACPIPVGTVLNYAYTGSYQEVTLPAGKYKLQCWGAQGGSNAAASSYSITANAGGKGGYSEGVITLSSPTTVRVYVGGAGSSSAGGFNGGGSTTGSSTYNAGDEQGVSRMGGGGGATDIRLSDGALLSRMIVAGGGGGGAMCYQKKTESSTKWTTVATFSATGDTYTTNPYTCYRWYTNHIESYLESGKTYRFVLNSGTSPSYIWIDKLSRSNAWVGRQTASINSSFTWSTPSNFSWAQLYIGFSTQNASASISLQVQESSSSTSTSNVSQVGYVGGGTNGGGYNYSYYGKQNGAGIDGSFGQGAHQFSKNNRYASGAGGGGWYGGGRGVSNSDMNACKMSGGGSGFVNTAANAQYRPSGYTGLQLDSGETKAGNTSFPNTAGSGNETGHSGNGYAKITRLV